MSRLTRPQRALRALLAIVLVVVLAHVAAGWYYSGQIHRDAIGLVSKNLHPELSYSAGIALICQSADARFVKIADNAHNSLPERIADLTAKTGKPTNPRYAEARKLLYAATEQRDVERILRRTNTSLLEEAQTR